MLNIFKIEKMDKAILNWEIYLFANDRVHVFIYPLGWWWACICFNSRQMFERYIDEWTDIDGYFDYNIMARHYNMGPFGIDIKNNDQN